MTFRTCCGFAVAIAVAVSGCSRDDATQPVPGDVSLGPGATLASAYTLVPLALPNLSTRGSADAINDNGWIVGWTDSVGGYNGDIGPTLWRPGAAPLRLQVLPAQGDPGSTAYDINSSGTIVGTTDGIGNPFAHGMTWSAAGIQTDAISGSPKKMAVLAPIPSPSVSTTANAKPLARHSERRT